MTPIDDNHRLNILVVSSQFPYPVDNGGAARLYHLYRRLKEKHHITWLSPIWPQHEPYIGEAHRFCHRLVELPRPDDPQFPENGWKHWLLRGVSRLHWERLFKYCFGYVDAPGLYWLRMSAERAAAMRDLLASSRFDLVVSEFEGNAELATLANGTPKIIVLHNIQSMLFRRIRQTYPATWEDRLFYRPELQKVIRYEKRFYSQYHLAMTVSEADRQALGRLCPSLPAEVIPNGVDVSAFRPAPANGKPGRTLIYFANYTTAPNADAIRYFCRQIFPKIRAQQPDARLLVVGNQPPPELARYEGVEVIGYVPNVRAAVAAADVVVVPLRVGGGTRLKIVEALALGKAVVSTPVGAEGLDVTHERDILLADSPESFAAATVRLLQQPDLRAQLGRNGRRLAEQVYDWDLLANRVDRLYRQVARRPAMVEA